MVLCLLTLTDLQTRRTCLSASADLLVDTSLSPSWCEDCRSKNSFDKRNWYFRG